MPGFTQIPNDEVFDDPLWTADEFTKGQALIDLYRLAQFKAGIVHKRGITIQLKPGQVGRSMVNLGKRWQWSIGKVRRYLNTLEIAGQIELQKTNVSTTITLLHWINNDTANKHADGKQTESQTESKRYPNNIDNTDNIDNSDNISIPIDPQLFKIFKDEYKKYCGESYLPTPGKDNKILHEMEKIYDKEVVIDGIRYFFQTYLATSPFARQNPNVGMLRQVWNGMVAMATEKSRKKREYDNWANDDE